MCFDDVWRAVVGFEGRYDISSLGRVRSHRGRGGRTLDPPKILRVQTNWAGYRRVLLTAPDGARKQYSIHRLVLSAFLGPAEEGETASHLNADRADNRLSNLAWESQARNAARIVTGRGRQSGETHHNATLSDAQVVEIREAYAEGGRQIALGKQYGVSQSTIGRIVTGATRTSAGGAIAPKIPPSKRSRHHSL